MPYSRTIVTNLSQRLVHGGNRVGEKMESWTLCTSEEEDAFRKSMNQGDPPFILMVDRGDCTFASKVLAVNETEKGKEVVREW